MRYIMLVVIGLIGVGCSSTTYQIKSESGKVVNTVPSWFMADIKNQRKVIYQCGLKKIIIKFAYTVWVLPYHQV